MTSTTNSNDSSNASGRGWYKGGRTSRNENRTDSTDRGTEAKERGDYKPIEKLVRAKLAVLSENKTTGWSKRVTVTRWNNGIFKLDIRDWNSDMTRSTKGLTFTRSETEKLRNILSILDLAIIEDYPDSGGERAKSAAAQPSVQAGTAGPVLQAIDTEIAGDFSNPFLPDQAADDNDNSSADIGAGEADADGEMLQAAV